MADGGRHSPAPGRSTTTPRFCDVLAGVVRRRLGVSTRRRGRRRRHRRVAVVGGGIAGLAAAWELRRPTGSGRDGPMPGWSCSRPAIGSAARSAPGASRAAGSTWPPTPSWPAGRRRSSVPGARDRRRAGARSGRRRRHLGPWPAAPPARRARPRRSHPVAAAPAVRDPRPADVPRVLGGPGARPGAATRPPGTGPSATSSASAGRPVVDRLVDPLIGGIHAGDADDLTRRPCSPPARRVPTAREPDAAAWAAQARAAGSGPAAGAGHRPGRWPRPRSSGRWSAPGRLVDALVEGLLTAASPSAPVPTCQAVQRPTGRGPSGPGGCCPSGQTGSPHGDGGSLEVDGVVLAAPAAATAALLAPLRPVSAGLLGRHPTTPPWPSSPSGRPGGSAGLLDGTGFLVPAPRWMGGRPDHRVHVDLGRSGRTWPGPATWCCARRWAASATTAPA